MTSWYGFTARPLARILGRIKLLFVITSGVLRCAFGCLYDQPTPRTVHQRDRARSYLKVRNISIIGLDYAARFRYLNPAMLG